MLQFFSKRSSLSLAAIRIGLVQPRGANNPGLEGQLSQLTNIDLTPIVSESVQNAAEFGSVNVLVCALDPSAEESLNEFDRLMALKPKELPVIVLSPSVDDDMVRWFLFLRVADWIKTPFPNGEFIAACGRVLSQSRSANASFRCVTFIGARGGVGATTLAVHAAHILNPTGNTCLVDLDLAGGACADYLDVTPGWQVDELISDPSRLDERMFAMMATVHSSGLPVLSAHRSYLAGNNFSEEVVTRVLDFASRRYANLVIDLPRHAERWTNNVLGGSTEVFVVTDFTIPGLRAARRLVGELSAELDSTVTPKVIVNRYDSGFLRAGLSASEVKKTLGQYFAGPVSDQPKLVREAIDRGVLTTEIKKGNALVRELAKLLERKL